MLNKWFYGTDGRMKVTEIEYHRNGICGNGFNIVNFVFQDGRKYRKMMAVIFEEKGNCAVFDQEMLGQGNIKFGENSWRGDDFEKDLRREIELYYDDAIVPCMEDQIVE